MEATNSVAIDVENLTKQYKGLTAVSDASFSIPRGSICGFVGPNGAGKTTTIRMLLGLIDPTSGSGHVLGHPINDPASYLKHVGALIEGSCTFRTRESSSSCKVG